jgi:hypothetical protein
MMLILIAALLVGNGLIISAVDEPGVAAIGCVTVALMWMPFVWLLSVDAGRARRWGYFGGLPLFVVGCVGATVFVLVR